MVDKITYQGTIIFDPKDRTKKHAFQSSWKKIAMVNFGGDLCEYYSWFFKKRYGITLNTPLRGPHISFINDHINDLNGGFYDKKSNGSDKERNIIWDELKKKYHNTKIDITISTKMQTNGQHVWLRIEHEDRVGLYDIRKEVGLPLPNLGKTKNGKLKPLGIHLTIGTAVNGRVNLDEFDMEYPKAGRMNLDNLKRFENIINNK